MLSAKSEALRADSPKESIDFLGTRICPELDNFGRRFGDDVTSRINPTFHARITRITVNSYENSLKLLLL